MTQSIYSGICRDGPWEGMLYTQTCEGERAKYAGRFNLIGLHGVRGSYTFRLNDGWRWGPWIEEPGIDLQPQR